MPKEAKKKSRKIVDLPGMEGKGVAPVHIQAVDDAAADYVKFRDRRMSATKLEVAAKQKLIDVLHKHEERIGRTPDGSIIYEYDETLVELHPVGEQLKVRAKAEPDED